jgi:hypothetical protein
MTLNITASIRRALRRGSDPDHHVHFHAGPDGPYVCDFARCDSPTLSAGEVGLR